jgi:CDP-diacylglycerol--glycerol-3-phosphate 3-phosphatidyltransferase
MGRLLLGPLARALVSAGVTANMVTVASLALGLVGGLLLAAGRFWAATPFVAFGSLGDALDGLVARAGGTTSPGGAVLDAAADRYQEMAVLGGLAVYFRGDIVPLTIALAALVGSYMVSYGSTKAEALRVPVPAGTMRRFERALCIFMGVALVPIVGWIAGEKAPGRWIAHAPVLVALALVAIVGNASAVLRLRVVAGSANRLASRGPAPGSAPSTRPVESQL